MTIRVVQWTRALSEIPEVPLGYGYMKFVSNNVYADPLLGWRGFNTHNEFLLQFLALGWIAPLALFWFLLEVTRRHAAEKTLATFVPVLIGLFVSAVFETFSNNANAVNSIALAYLVLAATLPGESVASDEVVALVEGPQRQVREYGTAYQERADFHGR